MMDHIHKLPFMTGGFMAVLTGVASYAAGSGSKSTYIRMAVVMVVFYIVGVCIRNTLMAINAEKAEKEELERLREQEAAAVAAMEQAARQNAGQDGGHGHLVDLVAGDDDGFMPLTASQIIGTKLKE